MDWNDLKLFLTVARAGSIRAAATELCVNQSTVNRRMDVLEHDLNLVLFDRSTRGFVLTEQGRAVAGAAAAMHDLAGRVHAEAERLRRSLAGTIKITAPQTMGAMYVAPIIEVFRRLHPDVQVEYDGSERRADLLAGEADVALRAGYVVPDDNYSADLVHEHHWAVYCSPTFADRNGIPACLDDLRRFAVVRLGGAIGDGPGNAWFMRHVDPAKVSGAASSVPNMANILHAGLGIGILPMITARQEHNLRLCFGPVPELTTRMWLVTTREARRNPRVVAFTKVALTWFREGNATMVEAAE